MPFFILNANKISKNAKAYSHNKVFAILAIEILLKNFEQKLPRERKK